MKRNYILLFICLLTINIPIRATSISIKNFSENLEKGQHKAEQTTDRLTTLIKQGKIDMLPKQTFQPDEGLFLVFKGSELIFWSDNWLVINELKTLPCGHWHYKQFPNAHCLIRWHDTGVGYGIFAILPIKYIYPIDSYYTQKHFPNYLRTNKEWEISYQPADDHGTKVYNQAGEYLFSLHTITTSQPLSPSLPIDQFMQETFSYTPLFEHNGTMDKENVAFRHSSQYRIKAYVAIFILLLVGYLLWIIYVLYRQKGFTNLRIGYKFQFAFSLIVLICMTALLLASVTSISKNYEKRQIATLQQKTTYIQKALQDIFYWNRSLTPYNTASLNVILKDLAYTYKTDIHVYDSYGQLIGSSQPFMFDIGLISKRISPKPYFSNKTNTIQYENIGSLPYLSAYTDFINGDYTPIGYISVPFFNSTNVIYTEIENMFALLLPIYIFTIILSIILTSLISKQITYPIQNLVETMRKLQIGERNKKLKFKANNEIGLLIEQYNQMVDEVERSTTLLARSERESAWKTMAQQVAHEIKNPLTPMKLTLQQLQRTKELHPERFDENFTKATNILIEQIDNLTLIANEFSYFAKMPEMQLEEIDIAHKLSTNIMVDQSETDQNPIITYHGQESGIWVMSDPKQIVQVFNNLLKNAIQALQGHSGGKIDIDLEQRTEDVIIRVSDNGPGIPQEIQDKIFLPNFTTKNTGMGLGLAIARRIIEESGGQIRFETSDKGTTFIISLIKAPEQFHVVSN